MEQNKRKNAKTSRRTAENEIRADDDPRVKKLLEFAETVDAQELVPVLEEEAAELIKEDAFAFALAGVLDRGTKAEIIWTIPYYIKKQLGALDPYFFANASLEELEKIIQKLPVKPRYVNDAPYTLRGLSQIIVNECNGRTQKLWENKSSRAVQATFERIYGVGPGIASMIILLLERWFGVHFDDIDHRNMDVKADVHIVRVFHRLGFISEPDSNSALKAARRLNPDYPGALDSPAWMIGRNWCTAFLPQCQKCPLDQVCPHAHTIKEGKIEPNKSIIDEKTATGPSMRATKAREQMPKTGLKEPTHAHNNYVVFEDFDRASGPKVHRANCFYYRRWLRNPTTTTTWHGPYESEEKAWEVCQKLASRSGLEPSKHRCVGYY